MVEKFKKKMAQVFKDTHKIFKKIPEKKCCNKSY